MDKMKHFNNTAEAIKHLNDLRKANKNKWVFETIIINNKLLKIKFYDTWTQILKINEKACDTCHGLNVKEWKNEIMCYL